MQQYYKQFGNQLMVIKVPEKVDNNLVNIISDGNALQP